MLLYLTRTRTIKALMVGLLVWLAGRGAHFLLSPALSGAYPLAVSHSGALAAVVCRPVVYIWDFSRGQTVARIPRKYPGPIFDAEFDPDGRRLALAASCGVVVWDLTTLSVTYSQGAVGSVEDLAFDDRERLVVVDQWGNVRFCDLRSGESTEWKLGLSQYETLLSARLSPNARFLAVKRVMAPGVEVYRCSEPPVRVCTARPTSTEVVSDFAFTPDNRQLIVGQVDGICSLYSVMNGGAASKTLKVPWIHRLEAAEAGSRWVSIAIDESGSKLAISQWQLGTTILSMPGFNKVINNPQTFPGASHVYFGRGGRHLILHQSNGHVRSYDLQTGRSRRFYSWLDPTLQLECYDVTGAVAFFGWLLCVCFFRAKKK